MKCDVLNISDCTISGSPFPESFLLAIAYWLGFGISCLLISVS